MSFVSSKRFNGIVMKNSSTYQDANLFNTLMSPLFERVNE